MQPPRQRLPKSQTALVQKIARRFRLLSALFGVVEQLMGAGFKHHHGDLLFALLDERRELRESQPDGGVERLANHQLWQIIILYIEECFHRQRTGIDGR